MSPDLPDQTPAADPAADRLEAALAALDHAASSHGDPVAALQDLSDPSLALVIAEATRRARAQPDVSALDRLRAARAVTLARNARPLHALVLQALADVAQELGDNAAAADALLHLDGLRSLLGQPAKAHAALLALARTQAQAGDPSLAERTFMQSIERARALQRQVDRASAATCLHQSLLGLGRFLTQQGRTDEALEWLAGAAELAPDDASRQVAQSALLTAQLREN
ncbi:MAG: hypothetical protein GXP62_13195 [Oligoflexia bacterium]|nr:hypothetical protein [Oligoflexia bacterium]